MEKSLLLCQKNQTASRSGNTFSPTQWRRSSYGEPGRSEEGKAKVVHAMVEESEDGNKVETSLADDEGS